MFAHNGFGMDYGAYSAPPGQKDFAFLHPDDAAISPIVRTAKPPSGFSPLTAPKRSSWSNGSSSTYKGSPLRSRDDDRTLTSIGNLSIEPGPRKSSASIKSAKSTSKISLKSPRSLVFRSSNERIREMDRERKRKPPKTAESGKSSARSAKPTARAAPNDPSTTNGNQIEKVVVDPRVTLDSPRESLQLDAQEPPVQQSPKADSNQHSPGGIGGGRFIPNRDSSLRHSLGSPPRSRRKSHRTHQIYVEDPQKHIEGRQTQGEASEARDAQKVSDDPAEDEVSRRIKELKAQKELRDRSQQAEEPHGDPESKRRIGTERSLLPLPSYKSDKGPGDPTSPLAELPNGQTRPSQQAPGSSATLSGDTPTVSRSGDMSPPPASALAKSKQNQSGSKRSSLSQSKHEPRPKGPAPLEAHKRTFSNPLSHVGRTSTFDDRPSTADSIDDAVEDYLASARLSQKISHPQTGRVISFSEVGDPDGSVVFCCVGMGMTRFLTAFYDELALTLKLRLITPDRPGIGESEAYTDGSDTPLGWPGKLLYSLASYSAGLTFSHR